MIPQNTNIYFSLGDAISILGIVIAVYGILRSRWRLNFTFNRRFLWSVLALLGLGLSSAFSGFVFAAYMNDDKLASTLQGAAFLFFLFAAIDFVRGAYWKKPLYRHKFRTKRKVKFIRGILDEVLFAKDEETLNAIITIIRISMNEICQDINRGDNKDNIAAYLLDTLLGESKIASHIAESRLDFISELIHAIEKYRLRGIDASIGVGNLLTALYINPKSYFYQQVGYDGLTNYASAYQIIFENEFFLREHGPVGIWYNVSQKVNYPNEVNNNPQFVEVFLKGYEMALKKFAYTHSSLTQELSRGMYQLAEYAESASHSIRKLHDYDYFTPAAEAFHKIVQFTSHSFYYDILEKKASAGQIPADELTPPLETDQYRENLSSSFCRLFTELAEAIITMHDKDEYERMEVIDLNEIYVNSIGTYAYIEGIRTKLLHMLWQKSDENIKRGHFPVVFRALAIMLYWQHNAMPNWAKSERNKLIDTLRNEVKPRILRDELMANRHTTKEDALLPTSIVFDRATNKFYAIDANDNRTELRKR